MNHGDSREEDLSQPWVHLVTGKDFVEVGSQLEVEGLTVWVWASK
jgi:hypothetical protein